MPFVIYFGNVLYSTTKCAVFFLLESEKQVSGSFCPRGKWEPPNKTFDYPHSLIDMLKNFELFGSCTRTEIPTLLAGNIE